MILAFCASLFLVACSRETRTDVSNDPERRGEFTVGEQYQARETLYLLEIKDEFRRFLALTPSADKKSRFRFFYPAPASATDQRIDAKNSSAYQMSATRQSVIPAHSTIKIIRIEQKYTWTWFFGGITTTTAYGRITNPTFSSRDINLTNVSYRYEIAKNEYLSKPNPNFLHPVTDKKIPLSR